MSADPSLRYTAHVNVPFSRISGFIRQVTHDVRNGLNAMDLQAAFVAELVDDPEASEEVKRLRAQIQQTARALQAISTNFWMSEPHPVSYSAQIFVEDFVDRLRRNFPEDAPSVEWQFQFGEELVAIDIEMIFAALSEIFRNAFQFREEGGSISAHAFVEDDRFILEITESKTTAAPDPQSWGLEPFVSTRRGAYGLGLFRARMLIAAHEGTIDFLPDSERAYLKVRVSLPLARPD